MLDLTQGGRMMSGLDAIEFMEGLADVFDEDTRTEEFCDEFEWALNRFRYEIRKSVPVPVRALKINFTTYSCGQCAVPVSPGNAFCGKCGRAIDWRHPVSEKVARRGPTKLHTGASANHEEEDRTHG